MPYFEALGFHITAFGCTTCIGNSGPLHPEIEKVIKEHNLNVAAVLSGNRNFEARIHQLVKIEFPRLADAGPGLRPRRPGRYRSHHRPLGLRSEQRAGVSGGHLAERRRLHATGISRHVTREAYDREYRQIFQGDKFWEALPITESTTYDWQAGSTYIQKPPYFDGFAHQPPARQDIAGARVLLLLGDTVTTDHISPAGAIAEQYPAGSHLIGRGIPPAQFNSYGSRRGNHEVMMRGTFGNIRIKNLLVSPREGSFTRKFPEGDILHVYEAAMQYQAEGVPLVVLAGKEYGTGSSRDWAAKGTSLLGVRVVIAESFERIHRNNLVGMGVLPLVFDAGQNSRSLGLDGTEVFALSGLSEMFPRKTVQVKAQKADGRVITFATVCRLDTEVDVIYFEHGGILPYVLRQIMHF